MDITFAPNLAVDDHKRIQTRATADGLRRALVQALDCLRAKLTA